MSWSPYPSAARQRSAVIVKDLLVAVALLALAWLGSRVYTVVGRVGVITDALASAGSSVQGGLQSAADAVASVPLVGDSLQSALSTAGDASGGNVVDLAAAGARAIHHVALLLGVLTFAIPAFVLLVLYVPLRVAQTRRLRAARLVYRDEHDPQRRQLLAMRAVVGLPVDHLLQFTDDPVGDLIAGRTDALVAALLDDAGLAPLPAPTR
jgi:hypothetical protein